MTRTLANAFAILTLTFCAGLAHACPACYGQADSPMTAGMNAAILTMVGIISFVLSGIVAVAVMMRRRFGRFAALNAATPPESTEHN